MNTCFQFYAACSSVGYPPPAHPTVYVTSVSGDNFGSLTVADNDGAGSWIINDSMHSLHFFFFFFRGWQALGFFFLAGQKKKKKNYQESYCLLGFSSLGSLGHSGSRILHCAGPHPLGSCTIEFL